MLTTSIKGEIGVAAAIGKLIDLGYSVSIPFSVCRYDLIADKTGILQRVQVKTIYGRTDASALKIKASSNGPSGRRVPYATSYATSIDVLLAYWQGARRWFWFDMHAHPALRNRGEFFIRLQPTKNGQNSGIRWAKQFEV